MMERITEADLDEALIPEGDVCRDCLAPDDCGEPDTDECRHAENCIRARLVAEVRRLRRLIAECFNGKDTMVTLAHLLEEAEAIRKEQASLDKRA